MVSPIFLMVCMDCMVFSLLMGLGRRRLGERLPDGRGWMWSDHGWLWGKADDVDDSHRNLKSKQVTFQRHRLPKPQKRNNEKEHKNIYICI